MAVVVMVAFAVAVVVGSGDRSCSSRRKLPCWLVTQEKEAEWFSVRDKTQFGRLWVQIQHFPESSLALPA